MIENKKAFFDYEILEQIECGIVLRGWEVKAIAKHACSIVGAHCKIMGSNVVLMGSSIGTANTNNFVSIAIGRFSSGELCVSENDVNRSRVLLLHKKEIAKLIGKIQTKGLTLVPLKLYNNTSGKYKLLIGLAKGKKEYDKRNTNKKRDIENENRRIVKSQKFKDL